ncbi:hypothetical protein K2173_009546 [Erythroxylum novogranatense]|uniref:Uncharacterized protein n=1 Tax=Erythroxylum novogranatense TaxID=1862640 RepID=A0AAV8U4D2_9ROSI|nr:hypothetical protein K2173_009546 [Erythroxylum novogranatense]
MWIGLIGVCGVVNCSVVDHWSGCLGANVSASVGVWCDSDWGGGLKGEHVKVRAPPDSLADIQSEREAENAAAQLKEAWKFLKHYYQSAGLL